MKRIWTWIILIILLTIYAFAAYQTTIANLSWGWVCAVDFVAIFIIIINLINAGNECGGQVSEDDKR